MITKLQAQHPRYKLSLADKQRRVSLNVPQAADLKTLWTDYCDLFDPNKQVNPYVDWVKKFDASKSRVSSSQINSSDTFEKSPLMSLVMPVYNSNLVWLEAAIASVQAQTYLHWQLCIADDASTDPAIRPLLERAARADSRISLVFREINGHISAASNSALALVRGEWVALLDHDDLLSQDALFWVVHAINTKPDCLMIYSDEDKIDAMGVRSDPYFKCKWNVDLFYSQNMFSHLGVYHVDLVREVGGFREGVEGSQDYDLALRCIERVTSDQVHHISRVLYHWRIHSQSTAYSSEAKPYAMVAGEKALNDHLERTGISAFASSIGYGYRVRYPLPEVLPLVSLIIPTRNGLHLLRQCIESIKAKTTYQSYEIIIVDNGSNDRATLNYLNTLALTPDVQVMRDSRPFNYSALNNSAVKIAKGEFIGLLNNDVEVINVDWLSEMVSHALRPKVAAVGARLWYPDNTLQHAGVVLGIHGIAGHVHRFLPRGDVGYCGRASLIQSFSAVTAACLVVRKSIYEELGGLNETELPVACNDVDFCLRA
ncbi:MAG: glycosyltransferase, partial [Candidatus Saccharibacteria bacterium]|nr:glycosyltransferase [Moraxellaceae bacterium]